MTSPGFSAEAARAQAFGAAFIEQEAETEEQILGSLLEGRITLRPHPAWAIPRRLTWTEDPFDDRNWQFQYHALRWLDPLRRAAARGDDSGMRLWERYARSWIEANPQTRPALRRAWTDMAVAARAQTFAFALPYLADTSWLVSSLREHGGWLSDPDNLTVHNHALQQHTALLVAGLVLADDGWVRLAIERLEVLLLESFDEQGANDEGSTHYALLNVVWWRAVLRRLELAGRPPLAGAARVTDLAPVFLAHASEPDGRLAMIGDSLRVTARQVDHPATRFAATAGRQGTAPEQLHRTYERGYIFGRSGWGEAGRPRTEHTYFTVRFGPATSLHGRPDGTSCTYTTGGVRWLTHTGKFSYDRGSAMRRYLCSRAGQNAVVVPGREYDSATTVELTGESHDDRFDTYLLEDRGYPGVSIRRLVCYSRQGEWLLIRDAIQADDDVDVESHLHLGPGVRAELEGARLNLSCGGARATILLGGEPPEIGMLTGSDAPMGGWVSEAWGERTAAPQVVMTRHGRVTQFLTVLTGVAVPGTEGLRFTAGGTDSARLIVVPGRNGSEHVVVDTGGVRPALPEAPATMPEPVKPASPARAGGARMPRSYDLALFRELQDEYRDKPLVPVARGLDPVSLTEQARTRVATLDRILPLRGTRLLEVGCGRGHLLRVLADEYDCDVVGVDVVEYPDWAERSDLSAHAHDIATLDNDFLGSFDRVISFAVWEHVVHPFAALKAARALLRPEGRMYLYANLYRGPKASHRYREIFFPWPHLLFQDDVIAAYYVQDLGRGPSRASWVNKLTTAQYLTYFERLDFSIDSLTWAVTPIDESFYERFEDILGRYPRYDLERDFIRAVVAPGRPHPAADHATVVTGLEGRLALAERENEALRRRVAELTARSANLPGSEVTSRTGG